MLFALAFGLASQARCAEDFIGTVHAITDGDKFKLQTDKDTIKIRLCGVDRHGPRPRPRGPSTKPLYDEIMAIAGEAE